MIAPFPDHCLLIPFYILCVAMYIVLLFINTANRVTGVHTGHAPGTFFFCHMLIMEIQ